MVEGNSTAIIRFACACQEVNGSVTVPSSTLPLAFEFCHCNVCRHQSGLLCASYLMLPEDATALKFEGPLTDYKSSDTVTRTFCSQCGANIYFRDSTKPRPDIATGILDKANGIVELRSHIFVPDTGDGGLTAWIPNIPAWKERPLPHQPGEQLKISPQKQIKANTERSSGILQAYCHCRGVRFKITSPSPNKGSKSLFAARSDLLWADVTDGTLDNKDDVKWWLCANDTKYLAGMCACQSCRLASGFDIQMWTFIPKSNILQVNGEPLNFNMGSLKQYNSSKGTYREFCSTCGATVFWHDETRPKLIDVSVGLLDAAEGARAESWLEWRTVRVSFEEEAQNKALIDSLGAGLQRWGSTDPSAEGKERDQERQVGGKSGPEENAKKAA